MDEPGTHCNVIDPGREEEKTIKTRKRTPKDVSGSFLSGLLPKNFELTITLPEEDKARLLDRLDKMTDTFDHRWKITQWLIIIGMVLNATSYLLAR